MKSIVLGSVVLTLLICKYGTQAVHLTEYEMRQKLAEYNNDALSLCNRAVKANWNVATDIGNVDKQKEKEKITVEYAKFTYERWQAFWRDAVIENYQDENIRRQLFFLKQLGNSALSEADLRELNQIVTDMSGVYAQATVCRYKQADCKDKYTLDPEITNVLAESRDFDELNYYWQQWHNNSGRKIRQQYRKYVELMNKAARANDYSDASKWWQSKYEDQNFVNNIDGLWEQVKPLYDELHTYARYKLLEIYGDKINRSDPNLPSHLFGNMWAQSWENLYDDIKPFKNASLIDITATLNKLNYTAKQMFETSDDFYTSLGLPTNVASFTGESVIEKPNDRIIQCHASAWDFCDGTDFRIKMCTKTNMEDFIVIHHEMGHIQYYIQYKDLPLALRGGANPGFHEAIGDTMALSVATPQHLLKLGLLTNYTDSVEDNVNALLSEALQRIAFLPFGLLVDKWRWDVFSGAVPESQWNTHWWRLREKYQKVSSPVRRSEMDFDPGAKYHVPGSSQYIAYFFAHLLEFQFYKSLCIEAGEYDPLNTAKKPLHKCDFYKSKAAGNKLAEGLKLGASKHWSYALEAITGETELTAQAILEYFDPLFKFLTQENQRLRKEDEVRKVLEQHNVVASEQCNKLVTAEWNVNTDINNETKQALLVKAVAENARFTKEQYNAYFKHFKQMSFVDEKIQRQVMHLSNLGPGILDDARLNEWLKVKANMENVYNNAKFCDYNKPDCNLDTEALTLDPEIMDIMEESTDFDRLKYIWTQWHNKSGALMRDDFKKYVEISNEAAKRNGFDDYGDMWRFEYEDPDFVRNMKLLWRKIEPLYDELHKYTRRQLISMYPNKINESDPLIPGHLLGNMWAQSWVNLYERIKPFKSADDVDVTKSLKEKKYTPLSMFKESDKFYKDLGLEPNEMSYTGESIIEKPDDRVIVCHASAWDFCNGRDFRIKQCTTVNQRNFLTIHHEMGHIEYFILYKDQPIAFRTGANPGFHEAVGDLISLSVSTPKHLKKIGLLDKYTPSDENTINSLLKMALDRVAFLPFGLLIDLYRWDVFSGRVPESQWNHHWEHLREEYQKIRSPVERTEQHFDAGAKYHIPADTQYIAYFVAHVLQFQFHRALCKEANEYVPGDASKPLHECDIAGSLAAGAKLRAGLSLGLSKHWKKALHEITGEDDISADALLEYFKPLYEYLKVQNEAAAQQSEPFEIVPVAVGVVLGSVLLLSLLVYLRYYFKNRKAVN